MARPQQYTSEGILEAAAHLAATHGPVGATIGAIAESLGAPTGSIYHRFRSKDVLLAELWLQTIESFQGGFQAALAGPDPYEAGIDAALYTVRWVRKHPVQAKLLLVHHRDDFVPGEWPPEVVERATEHRDRAQSAMRSFTRRALGTTNASARRRARFAVVEIPMAAVLTHVRADEAPRLIVDELVTEAYGALIEKAP